MCGIAGIARVDGPPPTVEALGRMAAAIRHRGPDGYGFYLTPSVGLTNVRLSIVDIGGGAQPMATSDGTMVIAYNGEVFNWIELQRELESLGHTFRTRCDTEVLLEAWRQWGPAAFNRLNGQFGFAIHDTRDDSVILGRDRYGVRPLFYAETGDALVFGSECKALFASGLVSARVDPTGIDEVFHWWSPRAPRTPFAGVRQLEPGSWARWKDGRLTVHKWWEPIPADRPGRESPDAIEELDALMRSAVGLRLRADVPVGAYLSGGLDSTITSILAAQQSPHTLRTFSIAFEDPALDERSFQEVVAKQVGSMHLVEMAGLRDVAACFPEVVRHAETPLVRTAPAPMYLLARRVREAGIKVVLTGEGSDELFLGYDLFKETVVRRFCLRQPDSTVRPRLFDRLYPYLDTGGGEMWRKFFLEAGPANDPLFAYQPRMGLTSRIREFYSGDLRAALQGTDVVEEWRSALPADFMRWTDLQRASYLEITALLAGYLLASQGDRMAMAHGVEGRFPFLDYRLFSFVTSLPDRSKLRGLHEKDILKRWAGSRVKVPHQVLERSKQPYRAPDADAFFGAGAPAYVEEMLSPTAVEEAGLFEPAAVAGLVRRCRSGKAKGFRENQALVGILSTQLWFNSFISRSREIEALPVTTADVMLSPVAGSLTGAEAP